MGRGQNEKRWVGRPKKFWVDGLRRRHWILKAFADDIGCTESTVARYCEIHGIDHRAEYEKYHGQPALYTSCLRARYCREHPAEVQAVMLENNGDVQKTAKHFGLRRNLMAAICRELDIDYKRLSSSWSGRQINLYGIRKLREITGDDSLLSIEDMRGQEQSTDRSDNWASQILGV